MTTLTIDGKTVSAKPGESLLDVARRSGAEVPSLCHHPLLVPYGACRVCLVEVSKNGKSKLTTSCNYEVQDGIEVRTDTAGVRKHRKAVLELLLALAPEAPAVQGLARANGITAARYQRIEPPSGRARCILCGQCSRVCTEVVGAAALCLSKRGDRRGLVAPFEERVAQSCIACGACAHVCPTDAVEMESAAIERLRALSADRRPCRYALMGMMPGALCPNNYDCALCEVDQRFQEASSPHHPVFVARGLHRPKAWEER
ncbi:MAG: 2Fe-2S iron-sulfur cluster-binding protein [Myxococcota bacterium]|jgi:NADH dehydrogenase/NADH:ubiquinone oxidoreductase subunit G|nr:2Fe-2S iron-sulfur cluster-binding protein [Myxococcota bacterium]